MTYLLDTNACIRVLNGSCEPLLARLRRQAPSESDYRRSLAPSCSTGLAGAHEWPTTCDSWPRSSRPSSPSRSTMRARSRTGALRASLSAAGRPIGPNDLLIAATALVHNLTLVTHNLREFSRVTGLKVEDWERAEP